MTTHVLQDILAVKHDKGLLQLLITYEENIKSDCGVQLLGLFQNYINCELIQMMSCMEYLTINII